MLVGGRARAASSPGIHRTLYLVSFKYSIDKCGGVPSGGRAATDRLCRSFLEPRKG